MATHEYADIPQTRRRIYIEATTDLGLSRNFSFSEPIPLTKAAIEWVDQTANNQRFIIAIRILHLTSISEKLTVGTYIVYLMARTQTNKW